MFEMSSTLAFELVDVKTSKVYRLNPGKQLVASKSYSGPEDVDLTVTCDENVTPFVVELLVKKNSARLTCIAGCCVAKSIGIGPGGTIKLKHGTTIEFGEVDCCVEMLFNIQQLQDHDESQTSKTDEVVQMKRPKRKLPETPGTPAQPPPKPVRRDQAPPPKPRRTRSQSTAAVLNSSPHVSQLDNSTGYIQNETAERKRKISKEVNSRKDYGAASEEVSTSVANSICYQLMLQPNSHGSITIKLITSINRATKVMEHHMRPQMEKFLKTYKEHLEMQATPECLLPADSPVIEHLLDALIRSPPMEDAKDVCSDIVEVLVMFCSSAQNCHNMLVHKGVNVLVTMMRISALQFCFELQCNSWKLLSLMIKTMLDTAMTGIRNDIVLEMSFSLARQQLSKFDNNVPLACAIIGYLVSAVTFCSNSSDPKLTSLQTGDLMHHAMSVAVNVKQNEQFKMLSSRLAVLLAPSLPSVTVFETEHSQTTGDIPIIADESFKANLDSFKVPSPLKTSVSTSKLERSSKPIKQPPTNPEDVINISERSTALHKSISAPQITDKSSYEVQQPKDEEASNIPRSRSKSKVQQAFFKFVNIAAGQSQKPVTHQPAQKHSLHRQMDMNNPYMKHTLKRTSNKNKESIDLSNKSSNTSSNGLPDETAEAPSPTHRQSWGKDMPDFSHLPGTIKEFSKEQACIEEMMDAHEDVMSVLSNRTTAIDTLVPLWCRGKSLQAAINAEASCFNEDDNDFVLFSDLLSLFKIHSSGWTLAVSLVFLRYFKQLLQNFSDPKYLKLTCGTLQMILERFADIILSCKHTSANNFKLSAQLDLQQKEMCYEELQEIHVLVAKELSTKVQMDTADTTGQEAVEHYRKLHKILEPFQQPLN